MTTAEQLWNDKTFIQKRIQEQKEYIKNQYIPLPNPYYDSAMFQLEKFQKRLEELNKILL